VAPRYQQAAFDFHSQKNKLQQVVSPYAEEGLWIHQNAWFNIGIFDKGKSFEYKLKQPQNGIYAFVIEGSFVINGQPLSKRDGMGIWDVSELSVESKSDDAEILLIEVPMQ
jgi:redox-sensitive bicupin YhaK (pirin superfamily)